MNPVHCSLLLWLVVLFGGVSSMTAAPVPPPRKLVMTGWDNPDTAQFRRDVRSVEQWPFDGTVLYALGRGSDGKVFDSKAAFSTNHWEPTCFSSALADLQAAHSEKLTDNFLLFGANPGSVDWFDDAGWREIREHCRLLARLAQAGGLKGLLFDPEPYTKPFTPFKYGSQAARAQHSFNDYCRKARQRGQEMMDAITSEFPKVVFYTYFAFSECSPTLGPSAEPQRELAGHAYGILPSFADGWLDRMPPAVTLIDGNEGAYRYNSEAAFNAAFIRIKNASQALVSPENRYKFRAQVQASHGIYLDAYVNPPTSPWYIDGQGGPRVKRLEQNVASALNAADEYVWVYGEKARWWPPRQTDAKASPPWPEVLPGIELALLNAKEPTEAARRQLQHLRSQGPLTNRLLNGDFAGAQKGQPASWSHWQAEKESHGSFSQDPAVGAAGPGSACLAGVEQGCFVQSVKVAPGQRYLIAGKTRQSGGGSAWMMVRWQTADGQWTSEERDKHFPAPTASDASGWGELLGSVTVPEGAGRLVVLAGASGQQNGNDRVWFDDLWVVPFEASATAPKP